MISAPARNRVWDNFISFSDHGAAFEEPIVAALGGVVDGPISEKGDEESIALSQMSHELVA